MNVAVAIWLVALVELSGHLKLQVLSEPLMIMMMAQDGQNNIVYFDFGKQFFLSGVGCAFFFRHSTIRAAATFRFFVYDLPARFNSPDI